MENKKIIVPVVVAALIILGVVGVFAYQGTKDSPKEEAVSMPSPTLAASPTPEATIAESQYNDGSYEATGEYVTPGGPRNVDVTIVIKDGVVTDSTFVGFATDPNSKRFQSEFAEGYKAMIVGKPVDEIALVKVSGSSLTPKGFMDALEKIKQQAV